MSAQARSKKSLGGSFVLAAFLLTIFGLVVLFTTSIPLSQQNFGESYFYFRHQLIFGLGAGIILFFIARFVGYRRLRLLALPFFILSIITLALVFVPQFSYSAGGATRWLTLGGLSFQPAEIAKLALILYLAAWLDKNRAKTGKTSSVISFLIIVGLIAGPIVLQPDIGTAALIVATALVMYFAAGAKIRAIIAVILIGLLFFGILVAQNPERISRLMAPFNVGQDTQGEGYQINQALIAIGSGGFTGKGLGKSVQKYQYLPESIGDSIFAIIGEELGFLGAGALLLVFIFLIFQGLKIAKKARTNFGTYLTVGIVTWLGFQTFLNVAGILGIFPFTGIPLPFISYGGTALAMELAAVGIVASVARE